MILHLLPARLTYRRKILWIWGSAPKPTVNKLRSCHCEARSAEAIQTSIFFAGLLRLRSQ
jgi:hypothetical protein